MPYYEPTISVRSTSTEPIPASGRRPTLLPSAYFLDRLVVMLGSLAVGFAIPILYFDNADSDVARAIDQVINPVICHCPNRPVPDLTPIFGFSPDAPIYVQYGQFVRTYLTWRPFGYTVLACIVLATVLQWRVGWR